MSNWARAKAVIGTERVLLGPQASQQWLVAPDHLAMVLARYRAAAALIGAGGTVLDVGCGEGIGARILADGRTYLGCDPDVGALDMVEERDPWGRDEDTVFHLSTSTIETLNPDVRTEAVVALDVIEHVEDGTAFLRAIVRHLQPHGVCVIGTPNARFDHLASPQSRAGHVATYTHDELYELMEQQFRVVQSFGMQDTALHLGHPEARHYLLMCGIGPRG